jgi:predicted nucleotidyltransferase component of viral defense system
MNTNKHKVMMSQILKDIYSDLELANYLGFKGGTAMFLFHGLNRFSVDLDFNLLNIEKEDIVYEKVRKIVLKYGKIVDEAKKFFGPIIVLSYEKGERNLKIEISNRQSECHYEMLDFMGITMQVMTEPDMFANKLCALLDRAALTNRDIFDCWFFLQNHTPINRAIVEKRMKKPFSEYIRDCINEIEKMSPNGLLAGIGEFVSPAQKSFIKNKLKDEILILLRFYQRFPIES